MIKCFTPQKKPELSEKTKEFIAERERIKPVYKEAVAKTKEVYKRAISTTKDLLRSARFGKNVMSSEFTGVVSQFTDSLYRNEDALLSLTKLKTFDDYTFIHSVNVSIICISMGKSLKYSKDDNKVLGMGGILHDIGKMRVPLRVLNKPGKFTDEDFAQMKKHPLYGAELLKEDKDVDPRARSIVLQHHERMNGKGYPFGLEQNQITDFAKIASIADVYDALTTKRVYKDAVLPHDAMSFIFNMRNKDFSPQFVEYFARDLGIFPIGSLVQLSNGMIGVVTSVNRQYLLSPKVRIVIGKDGKRLMKAFEIDLTVHKDNGKKISIVESLNPNQFKIDPHLYLSA